MNIDWEGLPVYRPNDLNAKKVSRSGITKTPLKIRKEKARKKKKAARKACRQRRRR